MIDSSERLESLTLAKWAAKVWMDFRRGVPLTGQNAAIAHFLKHHPEWFSLWDRLAHMHENDELPGEQLRHVFNDAGVKMHIDSGQPAEIRNLFEEMMRNGKFSELDCIHTIGFALAEETSRVRQGEMFDMERYVKSAQLHVKEALGAKKKVY